MHKNLRLKWKHFNIFCDFFYNNCFQFYSSLQDDFIIVHVLNDYDSVLESVFKTEFLTLLSTRYEAVMHRKLTVDISNKSVLTYISFSLLTLYSINRQIRAVVINFELWKRLQCSTILVIIFWHFLII